VAGGVGSRGKGGMPRDVLARGDVGNGTKVGSRERGEWEASRGRGKEEERRMKGGEVGAARVGGWRCRGKRKEGGWGKRKVRGAALGGGEGGRRGG